MDQVQPDLIPFLDVLDRELPNGQLNGATVIPFCERSVGKEMRSLFVPILTHTFNVETKKAQELKTAWDLVNPLIAARNDVEDPLLDSALATEPVFVIRLKCLLEAIRKNYGS